MPSTKDKQNRPVVVVTGMGVVTSLGAGKTENWEKLTAGQSGVKTISRFPTDNLKTKMAGTVDFLDVKPYSTAALSERLADLAAEEAVSEVRHRQTRGFSGPAVPRRAADRDRVAAAA